MKKVILTFLISAAFTAAFAQTSKAIFISGNYLQVGDFNPSNAAPSNTQSLGYVQSTPRDFIYDAVNGHFIYQDKTNGLVFCNIRGNSISSKNFNMNTTVMAPAYIPAEEKIVCFNVQKEFNGYGSNEENLFLSTIDIKKNKRENLIKFSDISFDNVTAPFYGIANMGERFNEKLGQMESVQKEVAISKPVYIADKDLYMVMVKDVMGTNRLYKIHVISPNHQVSSIRCEYNIIDMTAVKGTDMVKVLFFTNTTSGNELKVGDFNFVTNTMTNVSLISNFTGSQIDNGSIKFNNDQTQLFVSRFEGNNTNIYSLNVITNQNNSMAAYDGYVQYDFGFNETYYVPNTYSNIFGLFPNPSTGMVYFKNNSGVMPRSIMVYDNVGQMVRLIKVEEINSQTPIDLSEMAPGIYHVRVDIPGSEDFIGKVAVTK